MLEVIEILGRSEQGATRPFICRCSDNYVYFVKGRDATRDSQVHEWIAARMATELGIPIAPYEIVHVSPAMAALREAAGLGAGPAFGSRMISGAELTIPMLEDVKTETQADVLAFDWWIRNADRSLTASGGNPNLILTPEDKKLIVIDHNLAFDAQFSKEQFLACHVFRGMMGYILDDLIRRAEYLARFEAACKGLDECLSLLPGEWRFVDDEMTVEASWVKADPSPGDILLTYSSDDFWRSTP